MGLPRRRAGWRGGALLREARERVSRSRSLEGGGCGRQGVLSIRSGNRPKDILADDKGQARARDGSDVGAAGQGRGRDSVRSR